MILLFPFFGRLISEFVFRVLFFNACILQVTLSSAFLFRSLSPSLSPCWSSAQLYDLLYFLASIDHSVIPKIAYQSFQWNQFQFSIGTAKKKRRKTIEDSGLSASHSLSLSLLPSLPRVQTPVKQPASSHLPCICICVSVRSHCWGISIRSCRLV